MAESNAYLAYGIAVTTESLLYAVAAWPRLQGLFTFLNLVAKRKAESSFQATNARGAPHSAIELVSIELWDVVRHKVVDLELRAADAEHVASLVCARCVKRGISALDHNWTSAVDVVKCKLWVEYDGLRNPAREQATVQLLATFGLALPTPTPICATHVFGTTWPHVSAPDSATWISLPDSSGTSTNDLSIHAEDNDPDADHDQQIVDVSFVLPADAKQRFARLVSTMHLQLVEVTDGFVGHVAPLASSNLGNVRHDRRMFNKVAFDNLSPRWKLVTLTQSQR